METSTVPSTEEEVVQAGAALLRTHLPERWEVIVQPAEAFVQQTGTPPIPRRPGRFDGVIQVQAPGGGYGQFIVEARVRFEPRDVANLITGTNSMLLRQQSGGLLVIAPRLSARARELLIQANMKFIDLTGDIYFRVDSPPMVIERLLGPPPSGNAGAGSLQLGGATAGRVLRTLIDVVPPMRVKEIAEGVGVSIGYVSKILGSLDAEALIQRGARGTVEGCDWAALLRRWAGATSALQLGTSRRFIAPKGVAAFLRSIANLKSRWVLTGIYGGASLAPIAAPDVLTIYADDPTELQKTGGLLEMKGGTEVVLIEPRNDVVYWGSWRTQDPEAFPLAAPSQIAFDCLRGAGRSPAVGEELISWMEVHENSWRSRGIAGLASRDSLLSFGEPLLHDR